MAPRKLSDADKRQITSIYCQPGETTSTLAKKFDISSSTVSRVLKQVLPDEEYAKLMKWKRSGERGSFPLVSSAVVGQLDAESSPAETAVEPAPPETSSAAEEPAPAKVETAVSEESTDIPQPSDTKTPRRSRRRSTARSVTSPETSDSTGEKTAEEEATSEAAAEEVIPQPVKVNKQVSSAPAPTIEDEEQEVAAWVSEGLEDSEDYDEDADEDWDDETDDETWDDDSEEDETEPHSAPRETDLTIHSFDDFSLAKPCYLVVDRMAELITCPLKDFSELGAIPAGEEQARTLPVFDNHRIARRFARRNQRIIKVPDALMLNKTQGYLEAKGITRILFDGQVYALSH
ncbi:MAG: hypothetical protein F6K00_01010 [Leptolyngbya sp. SIOISBB]|nr:hypothetical protein [Leptolyngbya sp. SIOISBB]